MRNYSFELLVTIFSTMVQKDGDICFDQINARANGDSFRVKKITHLLNKHFFDTLSKRIHILRPFMPIFVKINNLYKELI